MGVFKQIAETLKWSSLVGGVWRTNYEPRCLLGFLGLRLSCDSLTISSGPGATVSCFWGFQRCPGPNRMSSSRRPLLQWGQTSRFHSYFETICIVGSGTSVYLFIFIFSLSLFLSRPLSSLHHSLCVSHLSLRYFHLALFLSLSLICHRWHEVKKTIKVPQSDGLVPAHTPSWREVERWLKIYPDESRARHQDSIEC